MKVYIIVGLEEKMVVSAKQTKWGHLGPATVEIEWKITHPQSLDRDDPILGAWPI